MPIVSQTDVDLGTHTLRITSDESTVGIDLFLKNAPEIERAQVSMNTLQNLQVIEALAGAGVKAII